MVRVDDPKDGKVDAVAIMYNRKTIDGFQSLEHALEVFLMLRRLFNVPLRPSCRHFLNTLEMYTVGPTTLTGMKEEFMNYYANLKAQ
jgi:hypothetical protein